LETGDDAAVYRLRDDLAIVVTTDFFTPIVDDPYTFGAIAAANALSDVYAMGATPLLALNLTAFPVKQLPPEVLADILRGGLEKAQEAGVLILGGHSIDDTEPKYGLAVTGTVHPDRIIRNRGGKPGDALVVTKPIGTGVIATALKHQVLPEGAYDLPIASMLQLNAPAAAAMAEVGVDAATDITGFGLLGHLHFLAQASRVAARVEAGRVPVFPEAQSLAEAGEVPGGTNSNRRFLEPLVTWEPACSPGRRILLCDAQTSGGLLIAVPPERLDLLQEALTQRAAGAWVIGELVEGKPGTLQVV
jgi:selenide,water dikinase